MYTYCLSHGNPIIISSTKYCMLFSNLRSTLTIIIVFQNLILLCKLVCVNAVPKVASIMRIIMCQISSNFCLRMQVLKLIACFNKIFLLMFIIQSYT